MGFNQTVDLGTDIASFFIFHPDDLKRRENDPLDWHAYDFACRKEFEAGNMVAFRTGGDGGYQLRLTDGDLTEAESDSKTGSWEWGYTVRHGTVLVDNGDFLPHEDARQKEDAPAEQWVSVPKGNYRVTVFPIAREDDTLPDYVVRFEQVAEPLPLALSPTPPVLEPILDNPPIAGFAMNADTIYGVREFTEPLQKTYPLLVAPDTVLLPKGSAQVPVDEAVFQTLTKDIMGDDTYLVLASENRVPCLATLARINGCSQRAGEAGKLKLQGEILVRVLHRTEGEPLPLAEIEPVTRADAPLDAAQVTNLQAAFDHYARNPATSKNKVASFDRERVAAMTNGETLTTRLIELLPLPAQTRFRLYGAPDADRAKALLALLQAG